MTVKEVPGFRWFSWVRNPILRVGVLTGTYLSAVMIVWLIAANRVAFLERFADIRNVGAAGLFVLTLLIPITVFWRAPTRLLVSGMIGWLFFTLVYWGAGMFFSRLHSRFYRPFHLFVLGAAAYGVAAVVFWMASMAREARHQPALGSRRRPRPY